MFHEHQRDDEFPKVLSSDLYLISPIFNPAYKPQTTIFSGITVHKIMSLWFTFIRNLSLPKLIKVDKGEQSLLTVWYSEGILEGIKNILENTYEYPHKST